MPNNFNKIMVCVFCSVAFLAYYSLLQYAKSPKIPSNYKKTQHLSPTPVSPIQSPPQKIERPLPQVPSHSPPIPTIKIENQTVLPAPAGDIENLDLVGVYGRKQEWAFLHIPSQKLVTIPEMTEPTLAETGNGTETIKIMLVKIDDERVEIRYDAKGKIFNLFDDPKTQVEITPTPMRPILGTGVNVVFGGSRKQEMKDTFSKEDTYSSKQKVSRGQWYSGGTLHKARMKEWNNASYSNRLATCADFVTKILQKEGSEIPQIDKIKPVAEVLEQNISEVNRGGVADDLSVAEVAAACWIIMVKNI